MKGSLPMFMGFLSGRDHALRPLRRSLVLPLVLFAQHVFAQTVVLNEVSNGPAGNMEYMELVVVPTAPLPTCAPPPCLDLRGWMIDDNNGYHGAGGVAPGAVRFADHPLWSCVPLGTIIALYNGADPNPSLPPDDVSLGDGNCSIVLSAMDLTYFEYTNNTPAAVPCDQPGGWGEDPNPTWAGNMALANTGDCARVADAEGCEVFALCYGNTTLNATVAFAGQGGDKVWYFNQGDPYNAANWSTGCAGDMGACGADDQTPGAPNNAANAAWLAGFNNACQPYTEDPLTASITATAACGCTGTAQATGQGSIAPYSFQWSNEDWAPLSGGNTASVTGLCSGIVHVVITSANGCVDTASVTINEIVPPDAGTNGTLALCASSDPADMFLALGGTPQSSGTWSPSPASGSLFDPAVDAPGTYTYTVAGTAPCDDAVAMVVVSVMDAPVIVPMVNDVSCTGANDGSISLVVQPEGVYVYTWSGGLPADASQSALSGGTYSVTVEDISGCSASNTMLIADPMPLGITTTVESATCVDPTGSACGTVTGGTGPISFAWSGPLGQTTACATDLQPGGYTVTATDANGCTTSTVVIINAELPSITVEPSVVDVSCAGDATGSISLAITPMGDHTVVWSGPNMAGAEGWIVEELVVGDYTYTITTVDGCTEVGSVPVNGPEALALFVEVTQESCAGVCDGAIVVGPVGGTAPWQLEVNEAVEMPGTIANLCAGIFPITVIDAHGCTVSATFTVASGAENLMAEIQPGPPLCETAPAVQLSATPIGGIWNGPGIENGAQGNFDPQLAGSGTHTISYTIPGVCALPAITELVVAPAPVADFTTSAGSQNTVEVESTSIHADLFNWQLEGEMIGTSATLTLPTSTFGEGGPERELCLTVTSDEGCSDTECILLNITSSVTIHVPNAFSPNGDGINDVFHPVINGLLDDATLSIFDRWGSVIHTADDKEMGWDGRSRGRDVQQGVYPWRLDIHGASGTNTQHGHVTLIR